MKRYAAYKDSGIEWIGEIPESWAVAKVGYYFNVQLGKMLQPEQSSPNDTCENYLCAQNINNAGLNLQTVKQMWFSLSEKPNYRLNHGDLLVVEGGDVGLCAVFNDEIDECYFQNALHRVTEKDGALNDFLRYWLAFLKVCGYLDLVCNKATIAHFTKDKFINTIICLPPQNEQHWIRKYLDKKTSAIDELIANKSRMIELLREKRQAIISEAVTKGLDKSVPMKDSGVKWIGEIPEQWSMSKSQWLFRQRKERAYKDDEQLTASQSLGIIYQKDYMEQEQQRVVQVIKGADILKHVEVNDFVISMRSFQGGIEWSGIKGKISSAYVMLIPNFDYVDVQYYKWLLKSQAYITALQSTTNLVRDGQALRFSNFCQIDLPVISLSEQHIIAEYLNIQIQRIDQLCFDIETQIERLKEYRQSLISEAVTGKIKVCEDTH